MMLDRDLSTRQIKETLLTLEKYWEEPKTGNWLYELWYIHMMQYWAFTESNVRKGDLTTLENIHNVT